MSYRKLTVFICLLFIIASGVRYWGVPYWQKHEIEMLKQELSMVEVEQQLRYIWRWGDYKMLISQGKLKCPSLPKLTKDINLTFLRCNPLFLSCLSQQKSSYFANRLHLEKVDGNRKFKLLLPENVFEIILRNTKGKERKVVYLPNNCFEINLPQQIYAWGKESKKEDWKWDNLDYFIKVDSEYVTRFAFNEWKRVKGRKVKKLLPKDLFRAEDSATYDEMKEFCFDHNKELLNARVYDAIAAFYFLTPTKEMKRVPRSIYPWRGRVENQFIHVARVDRSLRYSLRYCKKIYTKECIGKESFGVFLPRAKSVSGFNNALGGYLEAVLNKRYPEWNLVPSSFLFPLASPWHEIGIRVKWNKQVGKQQRIDWITEQGDGHTIPKMKKEGWGIVFRCMRVGKI